MDVGSPAATASRAIQHDRAFPCGQRQPDQRRLFIALPAADARPFGAQFAASRFHSTPTGSPNSAYSLVWLNSFQGSRPRCTSALLKLSHLGRGLSQ